MCYHNSGWYGIKYSDRNVAYRACDQCFVFRMWVAVFNIVSDRTVRTGHVVSVVCCVDYVGGSVLI